jgi:membrane-bound lytic murein transglycosylase B
MARDDKDCRVGWNTLAAIGQEESHHGGHGGAYIADNGHLVGRIIGPALDGGAYAAVTDTDHGRLDGDPTWDHAVGPMQILPSTWAQRGADGNGDGVKDPQDIDDAVLSAARYLCASGGDLQSGGGWTAAIRSYNPNDSYIRAVLSDADYYARTATMAK